MNTLANTSAGGVQIGLLSPPICGRAPEFSTYCVPCVDSSHDTLDRRVPFDGKKRIESGIVFFRFSSYHKPAHRLGFSLQRTAFPDTDTLFCPVSMMYLIGACLAILFGLISYIFKLANVSLTNYEDAGEEAIIGWDIYDSKLGRTAVANVYDASRWSRVIEITGSGTVNDYRLRNAKRGRS